MLSKTKKISLAAFGVMTVISIAAYAYPAKTTTFEHIEYVIIKEVMNWPPLNEDSPFYQGEYTAKEHRPFTQLLNGSGIRAIDNKNTQYLLPGNAELDKARYSLQSDNAGKYRLCATIAVYCTPITEYGSIFR
jgi:hypothetical protein